MKTIRFDKERAIRLMQRHGVYVTLAILLAGCCVSSEYFRSPQNLVNITRQVVYSGVIALGMTFVITGGGIDLSVGSLLALAGCAGISAMNRVADPVAGLLLGMAAALAVGGVGGAVNGALVTWGRIPPFIATLGTLSLYRSLALHAADAGLVTSSNQLYAALGSGGLFGLPTPVWIMAALTCGFAALLSRMRFGKHVAAVGANPKAARCSGIAIRRTVFATYLIAGLTSGLSAILLGSRLSSISSTNAGMSYELDAIAAVIIGGTSMAGGRGSVFGTLAGVLILGIISNVLDMWGVSVNLQGAVKGLVIIGAVLLQRERLSE